MISGECRVEPIPFTPSPGGDSKLSIEGLRLRLDLRILPGAPGSDAVAAAVWRVESANVAWLPFGGLRGWRRVALAAGVVGLGLALVVWVEHALSSRNLSSQEVSPPEPLARPSPAVRNRPAPAPGPASPPPASASSGPALDTGAAGAAAAAVPTPASGVAPRITVVQPEVDSPARSGASRQVADGTVRPPTAVASSGAAPRKAAARGAPSTVASSNAAKEPSPRSDSSVATSLSSQDMLDLFADTK